LVADIQGCKGAGLVLSASDESLDRISPGRREDIQRAGNAVEIIAIDDEPVEINVVQRHDI
jgi:hypothetical protein